MKLAVFGASGATGMCFLQHALQQHTIHAFVRPQSSFSMAHPHLKVIHGDFQDAQAIDQVVDGTDAILCFLGPRPPYKEAFCAQATAQIIAAAQRKGVSRFYCQTGAMIGGPRYNANRTLPMRWMEKMWKRSAPEAAQDRLQQEERIRQSSLDWLLLKPPRLTDKSPSQITVGPDIRVGLLSQISRHAIATWLLQELERPAHHQQALFLRNH
ncbi:MAG: NAD(P)H-binding protein [Myxococcales bacterium]|nr:NAD(P)H-binding protein [Myxococcales bacterium]